MITYVICSSKVRKVTHSVREGINTCRGKMIRLKDADADRILEKLAKEKKNIRREDFFPLLLAPLMGGKSGKEERIRKSIRALRKAEGMFSKEEVQSADPAANPHKNTPIASHGRRICQKFLPSSRTAIPDKSRPTAMGVFSK